MNNELKTPHLPITVYHSWENGNAKNCKYPNIGTGSTPEELKQLFRYDHTFIRFKNSYRSIDNFEEAAVAAADIDNDHSDNPSEWITIEDIPRLFPNVFCVAYTSRNHMKQKGKYSPRPRFHVVFLVDPITDPKAYTELMQRIQAAYPFFDEKALDAGRFFFGNPDTEVYIFPGNTTIDRFLDEQAAEDAFAEMERIIPEGSRKIDCPICGRKMFPKYDASHKPTSWQDCLGCGYRLDTSVDAVDTGDSHVQAMMKGGDVKW